MSSDEEDDLADVIEEEAHLTPEELASRAETDNLLWHRFLAVFLWPAVLTIAGWVHEKCLFSNTQEFLHNIFVTCFKYLIHIYSLLPLKKNILLVLK